MDKVINLKEQFIARDALLTEKLVNKDVNFLTFDF